MLPTVRDVYGAIDRIAPFGTAEEWDNVGILAGDPDAPVQRALVALDLTAGALEEAVALGASLMIVHHPIFFHPRRNLREDDQEGALLCALVRSGVALIAAHTNLDKAEGGVNNALAEALSLHDVVSAGQGFLRTGALETDRALADFTSDVEMALCTRARMYGNPAERIRRVAVCGGAGGQFWREAFENGADCLVTGEIHHHEALAAVESGLTCVEAGHRETERTVIRPLAQGLQSAAHLLQWEITIFTSQYEPFGA